MFTGIVETTGWVRRTQSDPDGRRLEIEAPSIVGTLDPGQSVSVDGVCLTVETIEDGAFSVFLAAETVERTTLAARSEGAAVNLERALPADGRFDGHIVQGHVDTTTEVLDVQDVGEDWRYTFAVPERYAQYLVAKGSVALDGISLTIADRATGSFDVAIVPSTYDRTTLSARTPGDRVNLEVDVVAKYVESLLEPEEGT